MALLKCFYLCLISVCGIILAEKYTEHDEVVVYVNKVGPYHNPHETYHYYELPVCRPKEIKRRSLSLGELLDGDRMAFSEYKIYFGVNAKLKLLCSISLSKEDVEKLRNAIEDLYYFEFVIDDIPVRGFIGDLQEGLSLPHKHFISFFTHHQFSFEYNGDEVVFANISVNESPNMKISLDEVVQYPFVINFTYSIKWSQVTMKREERMKKVKESSFFANNLEVHWLSIVNSMILVFLLLVFVIIILTRILRKDFARYNLQDDDGLEDEDNGWKIIQADVFRFPKYKSLFCAILGVGTQFLTIASSILLLAVAGAFNVHRHGSINSASIILYALTSCVSGYVAATMYKKMGGENWVWNINLTSFLFAGVSFTVYVLTSVGMVVYVFSFGDVDSARLGPFLIVWSFLNTLAWVYGSTQALPWSTIVLLGALWVILGYPLTVISGILGKNHAGTFDAPCRTKNIAREIPSIPLYKSSLAHCVIGGFLPFSAISVELYYIFATLWGREQYTLYGILLVVYIILLVVTACISAALTYFQLSLEDYRWWWRSIFSAGSTGIFVFLYAVFYYVRRSSMHGLLQTADFFGSTLLVCYIFFLMLGTLSFFSSLKFIKFIYMNIKMD